MTTKTRKKAYSRTPAMGVLGSKLRVSRIHANLHTRELGEMLGVSGQTITNWEQGRMIPPQQLDKLADVFGWDDQPRQEPPRVEPPMPVTPALRVAMSVIEDELSFSITKYRHAINYISKNTQELFDRYERLMRELHTLEQTQGITSEQLAILRDKASRYDRMQELIGRKQL